MNLLTEDLYNELEFRVKNAKRSIFIVSPYIKKEPAQKIASLVGKKGLELKFLTIVPGEEYLTGATDLEAILILQNCGFEIQMLPYLHAKIYLIDKEFLLLGSANFTNKGLGLAEENSNKEILIEKKAIVEEINFIENEFWNNEEGVSIDQYSCFESTVKMLQEKYKEMINDQLVKINLDFEKHFPIKTPHEQLLIRLKNNGMIKSYNHEGKGFLKHAYKLNEKHIIKVMRSIGGTYHQAKGFEAVYNYQITKSSAALFHDRKVKALILILEGPDQFVCLPTTFIIKNLLRKSYAKKDLSYQFKLRQQKDRLILTIKGKGRIRSHDITKYQNDIHLRILK